MLTVYPLSPLVVIDARYDPCIYIALDVYSIPHPLFTDTHTYPTMLHVALRDQLSIQTWLVLGASIQSLLLLFIPRQYVIAPIISILLYTVTRTALQTLKWVPYTPTPAHIKGRYSAMPPLSLAEGEPQPMVVFILGFDSSHPLGKLGPGLKELGQFFLEIIKEAEDNRSTSGYLGTSGPMLTMDGDSSNALVTITYWRSLEELEAFNKQGTHLRAIQWFNATREKYPHIGTLSLCFLMCLADTIGIMHELYNVPAGHHENVYYNYRPFGLVNTSYLVDGELGEKEIVKAEVVKEGQGLESSYGRMKRGMKA